MSDSRSAPPTPFSMMGNSEALVRELVSHFYAHMAAGEPDLARTHAQAEDGTISSRTQTRFADFLIEWLGGPARFTPENGHPRLRMRHAHVPIDSRMRDAWIRCMQAAMDKVGVSGDVRRFLDSRFLEVADFLKNRPDPDQSGNSMP